MASSTKPLVLICVTPFYGHVMPLRAIGKQLISRGYEVTFVTSSAYKTLMEGDGASFVSLEGYSDFTEADIDPKWPVRKTLPPGPIQLAYDLEHCFVDAIPSQHEALQKALRKLKDRYPDRKTVIVSESVFFGIDPILAGSPGLKPTATLSIGIVPMFLSSIDTAPFGPGILPPTTSEERGKYKAMQQGMQEQVLGSAQRKYTEIWEQLGCKDPAMFFLDAAHLLPDRHLQMCIPSVEYPRSDAPDTIRFAGGLPKGQRDAFSDPPSWWSEVINNKTKKIIGISQGSVAMDFDDLIIPTMNGLADRDDILVVVALGRKGAELPEGTPVPANARVADFVPFDELMPHCSAFISNGGYGTFQHTVSHGIPIIVGGETEDKPETAARAEWCGMGINLRTGTVTPEQIRTAVTEILTNSKYKKRALELEKEMASFDPIGIVSQNIDELAAGI